MISATGFFILFFFSRTMDFFLSCRGSVVPEMGECRRAAGFVCAALTTDFVCFFALLLLLLHCTGCDRICEMCVASAVVWVPVAYQQHSHTHKCEIEANKRCLPVCLSQRLKHIFAHKQTNNTIHTHTQTGMTTRSSWLPVSVSVYCVECWDSKTVAVVVWLCMCTKRVTPKKINTNHHRTVIAPTGIAQLSFISSCCNIATSIVLTK